MKSLFLGLEIFLGIAAVTIYSAAKVHFFTAYNGNVPVYLHHHWRFWAAQAIIVSALAGTEAMRRRSTVD